MIGPHPVMFEILVITVHGGGHFGHKGALMTKISTLGGWGPITVGNARGHFGHKGDPLGTILGIMGDPLGPFWWSPPPRVEILVIRVPIPKWPLGVPHRDWSPPPKGRNFGQRGQNGP